MFIPGLLWTLIIWTTILGATKAQPLSGHVLEPILTEVGGQVIPNIAQGMKNDTQQALWTASQWIQNIGKKLGRVWYFKSLKTGHQMSATKDFDNKSMSATLSRTIIIA